MFTLRSYLGITIILIFFCSSCVKEDIIEDTTIITPQPQEIISVSVRGIVIDENMNPISEAIVKYRSGEQNALIITDENGCFEFIDVNNKGNSAYISVEKADKFEAYRRLSVIENQSNYTEIRMKTKNIIGQVNSNTGGLIEDVTGASIWIPARGIINSNGTPYNGLINIAMAWVDPTATDLSQQMIGDFSGINNNSESVALNTFGMLQVELLDASGNELNLAEDTECTLVFPVPIALQSEAPRVIPLSSYNKTLGTWIQEGEAVYENGTYAGKISHFNNWSVNSIVEPIELKGRVSINMGSRVITPSYLEIHTTGEKFSQIGGWLNEEGHFLFYNFPKDEVFDLKIIDECDEIIYQQTFGPYNSDTDLGLINVYAPEANLASIRGTAISCDGTPVKNGYITIHLMNGIHKFSLESDGTFNISFSVCQTDNIELIVTDLDNQQVSNTNEIVPSTDNWVDLEYVLTCNDLIDFFTLNINGSEEVTFIDDETNILSPLSSPPSYDINNNKILNSLVYTLVLNLGNAMTEENVDYLIPSFYYGFNVAGETDFEIINLDSTDTIHINFSAKNIIWAGTFEGTASKMVSGQVVEKVNVSGNFIIPHL